MYLKIYSMLLLGFTLYACSHNGNIKPNPGVSAQAGNSDSRANDRQMINKICPPKSGSVRDLKPCKLKITHAEFGGVRAHAWENFRIIFSAVNHKLKVRFRERDCPDGRLSGTNCRKIPHHPGVAVKSVFTPSHNGGGVLEYIYIPQDDHRSHPQYHCLKINMNAVPDSNNQDFTFLVFHIKPAKDINDLKCSQVIENKVYRMEKNHDSTSGGGRRIILSHTITSGGGRYSY